MTELFDWSVPRCTDTDVARVSAACESAGTGVFNVSLGLSPEVVGSAETAVFAGVGGCATVISDFGGAANASTSSCSSCSSRCDRVPVTVPPTARVSDSDLLVSREFRRSSAQMNRIIAPSTSSGGLGVSSILTINPSRVTVAPAEGLQASIPWCH